MMAVQVTFDLASQQDAKIVMDLIGRTEVARMMCAPVETNLVPVGHAAPGMTDVPPDHPELTDTAMRAAFKDCYLRVGQEKAYAILHEYGEKLDKVDKAKYPELFKKWRDA